MSVQSEGIASAVSGRKLSAKNMKLKIDYSNSGELFPDELEKLLNSAFKTTYMPNKISKIIFEVLKWLGQKA